MGTTSDARTSLFGDIRPFVRLLAARADALSRAYPDPDLRPIFASLPHRSIAVAPMALCSALAQDLGSTPPSLLLEGLGVLCLHISTHDDIVDQRPASRRAVGALLFGGNIAALTGMQLIREATDAGSTSFPLREGPPYDESFRQVFSHLDKAARALAPKWARLRQLIQLVRAYAGERANVRTPRRA